MDGDTEKDFEPSGQSAVLIRQPQASAPPGVFTDDPYREGFDQDRRHGAQLTVNMTVQQQQQLIRQRQLRTWSTTMCGCCEDMSSCCCVFWCPVCYVSCSMSPRMGESCCAPWCLTFGGQSAALVYRTKMRATHGIAGGAVDDCCVSWCCPGCVLCQIKREIDFVERTTGMTAF